ncbi:MAG: DUF4097 family beta strand repeat protein [Clostridia bacterium]|nr:DUF4097 family beta strand repeat protein [Clostridia bacterium]
MKRAKKIWLITAASLLMLGCVIFVAVMTMLNWDFTKLSTSNYETNTHKISEAFRDISVETNTADITFVPTENAECFVECFEQENLKHSVTVNNGKLMIRVDDTRKWYHFISLGFDSPKITVYLPRGKYDALSVESDTGDVEIPSDFSFTSIDISEDTGDVKSFASVSGAVRIHTSTGRIRLADITVGSMELKTSTGNVIASDIICAGDISVTVSTGETHLSAVTCQNLTTKGSTGALTLEQVVANGNFNIERSTGDVTFVGSDAAEIFVYTDTGDVEGILLTDKVFIVNSDTGEIDVPNSITGGRCEITTDTGDIKIKIHN